MRPDLQKKAKLHQLSSEQLLGINRAFFIDKLAPREIAAQFTINRLLVYRVIKGFRSKSGYCEALQAKEQVARTKMEATVAVVEAFISRDQHIWRMSQITDEVKREHGLTVTDALVSRVLRGRFGMRYRRVQHVAFTGNSERCLALRQLFAERLLHQLQKGTRFLNVDESWINSGDMRHMKWRKKGQTNSISDKAIQPRLSVIAAIDTEGEAYLSLSIANTDSDTFRLFIQKLAKKLDQDRPGWKEDTTVLIDNAKYHASQKTREYFAHHGIKTMYTAPYSYSGSPIELFFAALKSTNLNPTMQATGKR